MRKFLVVFAIVALAGCEAPNFPLEPGHDVFDLGPSPAILDGAHNSGNEHFFWLPPPCGGSGVLG